MKRFNLTQIALLTMFLMGSYTAQASGRDGGGGTGVRVGKKLVLLDLFLSSPNFKDTYKDPDFQRLNVNMGPLAMKAVREKFNVRPENPPGSDGRTWLSVGISGYRLNLLRDRLNLWRKSSPILIGAVIASMLQTEYRVYLRNLPKIKDFYLPSNVNPKNHDFVTLAYYHGPFVFQTYLTPEVFTELGDLSFGGVILHEALRKLKVHDRAEISEKVLQELTAKIMLKDPGPGETLDSEVVLGVPVMDFKRSAFPLTVMCDRLTSFLNEVPVAEIHQIRKENCGSSPKLRLELSNSDYILERAARMEKIHLHIFQNLEQVKRQLTERSRLKVDELYSFVNTLSIWNLSHYGGYSSNRIFIVYCLPEDRQSHWPIR